MIPCIVRPSATAMILNKQILDFHGKGFHLPVPFWCGGIIHRVNDFFWVSSQYSAHDRASVLLCNHYYMINALSLLLCDNSHWYLTKFHKDKKFPIHSNYSVTYPQCGTVMLATRIHIRYLTHLPLHKMATISQMRFSDAFSWMKSCIFWLKFYWSLFLRVQLTITQHCFR